MGITLFASAQISNSQSSNNTVTTRASKKTHKTHYKKDRRLHRIVKHYNNMVQPGKMNQRRMYKWDSGQSATPTGEEATGVGAAHSSKTTDTTKKKVRQ
ncbi:MAG: hypothetical protein ICV66_07680 [Chitinophagaceae bacterium]|nr:hypothetical protein [Chitinophagaceae bacterium]